jgi:uncharacterized membrane protein YdbT with pleckstrin-like domain
MRSSSRLPEVVVCVLYVRADVIAYNSSNNIILLRFYSFSFKL